MGTENDETVEGLKAELKKIREKNRELLAKNAEIETERDEWKKKGERAEKLDKQLEDSKTAHKAEKTAWEEERSVYQSGITDAEAIDVARTIYNRTPAEGRKPFPEWLKAATEEPGKAPKALQPYLPQPSKGTDAGAGKGASGATGAKADAGAGKGKGGLAGDGARTMTTPQHTPEELQAILLEARRTGDMSKYQAIRGEVLAQIGAAPPPKADEGAAAGR